MLPLLDVERVGSLERYLGEIGTVFRIFDRQDSGCVSYGVAVGAQRWFVKAARTAAAVESLRRARALHAAVRHPVIIPLRHSFLADGMPALVYPWTDGELLYAASVHRAVRRSDPDAPLARFRRLPVGEIEQVIDRIFDAHIAVERAGYVAVDFYDGCLLYDFDRRQVHLLDFDEYRPGPFVATEQLSGSRRFMAPEEIGTGGTIDIRTTVFTLGRAARLLLDAGADGADPDGGAEAAWRGNAEQLAVVRRATQPRPSRRYPSVAALARSWQRSG